MENNFDREVDILLRQAAQSGHFVSTADFDAHLDADEISMFAENALPEKARNRAIKHLAECNNCRSILSNLVLLNEEKELETVSSATEEKTVKSAAVPWYNKLFSFPQIAYGMGALALVFSGAVGFLIYQTENQSNSFEMAKSAPTEMMNTNASGLNASNSEPELPELAENPTNTTETNTSVASNLTGITPSADNQSANANVATPNVPTPQFPSVERSREIESKAKEESIQNQIIPKVSATPASADRKTATDKDSAAEMSSADDSPPVTTRSAPQPQAKSSKKDEDRTKLAGNAETRKQLGGKIFNRTNGVWIDSDYRQTANMQLPMTTTVRRGTNEYKKLDKNIRIIAEQLDGAVIIVSGNKTYRIQ